MKKPKGAILGLVVLASAFGGSALAAAGSVVSRPRVQIDTTVRHQPPELEVYGVVAVDGVTPKPLGVEGGVLFDREGNLGYPELFVTIGRVGNPQTFSVGFEESDDPSPTPNPTNGRITKAVITTLDFVCESTGLC